MIGSSLQPSALSDKSDIGLRLVKQHCSNLENYLAEVVYVFPEYLYTNDALPVPIVYNLSVAVF